jgi:ribonuclease J
VIIKVLDGHNVIGGNKILVEGENLGVILDFGLNFSSWGRYFEEFLAPRTGLMIKDLLRLGLIPPIDIYRNDFSSGIELSKPSKDIIFTFLSHAHMDHIGLIGLIREDIPILSTSETLAIIIALNEIHPDEKSSLKIEDRVKGEYPIRKDVMIKNRGRKNRAFKKRHLVYSGETGIFSLPLVGEDIREVFEETSLEESLSTSIVNAKVFPVYHSVIGASSLYFELDRAKILYTGDLRDTPSSDEEKILEEIGQYRVNLAKSTKEMIESIKGNVDILIVEGTRVGMEDKHGDVTEATLYNNIYNEIKSTDGNLVIADFPLRHLERFHTFLKIAKDLGRLLVVLPKDYILLKTLTLVNSEWKVEEKFFDCLRIYHQGKGDWKGWEGRLLKGEIFSDPPIEHLIITPEEIEKDKGLHILNLGYFEFSNLLDFSLETLKGSIYIHSNSEAYTEEQTIDFNRLLNWLEYFHIEPKGIRRINRRIEFDRLYHASGHISPWGLEKTIEEINPSIIIPVHTQHPEWFEARWGKKVYLNSDIILV